MERKRGQEERITLHLQVGLTGQVSTVKQTPAHQNGNQIVFAKKNKNFINNKLLPIEI